MAKGLNRLWWSLALMAVCSWGVVANFAGVYARDIMIERGLRLYDISTLFLLWSGSFAIGSVAATAEGVFGKGHFAVIATGSTIGTIGMVGFVCVGDRFGMFGAEVLLGLAGGLTLTGVHSAAKNLDQRSLARFFATVDATFSAGIGIAPLAHGLLQLHWKSVALAVATVLAIVSSIGFFGGRGGAAAAIANLPGLDFTKTWLHGIRSGKAFLLGAVCYGAVEWGENVWLSSMYIAPTVGDFALAALNMSALLGRLSVATVPTFNNRYTAKIILLLICLGTIMQAVAHNVLFQITGCVAAGWGVGSILSIAISSQVLRSGQPPKLISSITFIGVTFGGNCAVLAIGSQNHIDRDTFFRVVHFSSAVLCLCWWRLATQHIAPHIRDRVS